MTVLEDNGYYTIKGAVDWKLYESKAFDRWGINDQIYPRYISKISADEPDSCKIYEQVVDSYANSAVLVKFILNDIGRKSYHKDMIIWFIPTYEYEEFYKNELVEINNKIK